MTRFLLSLFFVLPIFLSAQDNKEDDLPDPTKMTAYEGYFTFYWDEEKGTVWLELDEFDTEFLFVHSLPAGLGSNDIGLDRGQISSGKVVSFRRSGPKVLLVQSNYDYRAVSDNPAERRAVREAFAESVIWGFELKKLPDDRILIDLTPLILSDQHGVVNRLKSSKQGTYSLDADRSAIYMSMLRSFPENTEFEATLTFKGKPEGDYVRSVTPDAESLTVRQHLSFIKLPDPGYEPRMHHPLSGFIYTAFYDYAQPIDQPIQQRYIIRHRLEKKNPAAEMSEPIEPIIYYLDPGTPEPVRSALLEGARWWNEAFEAAGYRNAFRVEMLPEGADPMDVRYNLIQWVHRSTRGWSYGASVVDPRTGEIIKGHVSLGSLRVRQDFLIAQGLIPLFEDGPEPDPIALEMALARLRQLSAHEVGHTIGLTHNFAASINDRASVMDYPHPYILATEDGNPDFSNAYATGIGEWDKRAIWYGYQDFPSRIDEEPALTNYLRETQELGFLFISDTDARPTGGANPHGHLWDNSQQPSEELLRILNLRKQRLGQLNRDFLAPDQPAFELERLLTPLYMAHRYQVEAVVKMIGGVSYSYSPWLDAEIASSPVPESDQQEALEAILQTLHPAHLCIPEVVLQQLAPPPHGYNRDREFFPSYTYPTFDPVAAAETSASHSIGLLMEQHRLVRIARQHALGQRQESLNDYLEIITTRIFTVEKSTSYQKQVMQSVESLFLEQLFRSGSMKHPDAAMASAIHWQLTRIEAQLQKETSSSPTAHDLWLLDRIRQYRTMPDTFEPLPKPKAPPGSPIGCGE